MIFLWQLLNVYDNYYFSVTIMNFLWILLQFYVMIIKFLRHITKMWQIITKVLQDVIFFYQLCYNECNIYAHFRQNPAKWAQKLYIHTGKCINIQKMHANLSRNDKNLSKKGIDMYRVFMV